MAILMCVTYIRGSCIGKEHGVDNEEPHEETTESSH